MTCGALFAAGAWSATAHADPAPDEALKQAVQRDLGISWEEYLKRGAQVEVANQIDAELLGTQGYHGTSLKGSKVVVSGDGNKVTATARKFGAELTHPAEGGQQAARPDQIASKYLAEVGPDGLSSVMTTANGVRVSVDQPARPRSAAPGKRAKTPEEFARENPGVEVRNRQPAKRRADVMGGQGYVISGSGGAWYCSIGYAAYNSTGKPTMLSAGHCTQDGSSREARFEPDSNVYLGAIEYTQFGGVGNKANDWNDPKATDFTAYTNLSSNANLLPQVSNWAGGGVQVTGAVSPVAGAPVCQSGRTTKRWNCSTIESVGPFSVYGKDNTVRWSKGFDTKMTTLAGDSGGSMISGLKAVGILSAGLNENGVEYSMGSDLSEVFAHGYSLEVALNSPQANPGAAGSVVQGRIPVPAGDSLPANTKVKITSGTGTETVAVGADGKFSFTVPAAGRADLTVVNGYSASPTAAWDAMGGTASGPRICGLKDNGCYQIYTGGSMYWSPAGQWLVKGGIRDKWATTGYETGRLGYPSGPEICGLRDGGCFQNFQGGHITWSPSTGAHTVWGAIRDAYGRVGWDKSTLGLPTTDEICANGGCFQNYQGGHIAWTPGTGAHPVWGAIRSEYGRTGWDRGGLGWPTSDEICGIKNGGCFQNFQRGHIAWSARTGAHAVWGAIRDAYGRSGWDRGVLGLPVTGEICGLKQGGCYQNYEGGHIAWTPGTGAHAVSGDIRAKYAAYGWDQGRFGFPASDVMCGLRGGGCGQHFQGGSIYWVAATGAQPTWGAIRDYWAANGWEGGRFGYPTAPEQCSAGTCTQRFQGGTISWNATRGAFG